MKTSNKGVDFICKFEGFSAKTYKCSAGVLTIGYGHTKGVKAGDCVTKEQAKELLKQDLETCENAISQYVKISLAQHEFDALVSFIFNLGVGAFRSSTLLVKLNKGDLQGASDEILRWDKCKGKPLAGLTRRRKAERNLFKFGEY